MKHKKFILIIDDKDQSAQAEYINNKLNSKFDIEVIFINTSENGVDDSEEPSWEILSNFIKNTIRNKQISLALTDYDLGSPTYDGIRVVEFLRNKRHHLPIILYSGVQQEVIKNVIHEHELSYDSVINCVNKFLIYNIEKFIDRPDYPDCAVNYINNHKEKDTDALFISELRKYEDKKYRLCTPRFSNLTLGQIADKIEKNDAEALIWQKELIEQTISYLTEINE